MNITEQKKAVKAFVEKWSTKEVSERGGYQIFWIELMQNVLGDTNASNRINAEEKVRVDNHTKPATFNAPVFATLSIFICLT